MFKIKHLVFTFIVVPGLLFRLVNTKHHYSSDFTHEELVKIKPELIIDYGMLEDEDSYKDDINSLSYHLIQRGLILKTPTGMVYNSNTSYISPSISVVIQSGGGYIKLGYYLIQTLIDIRKTGIKINCYVSEAQSMAFTVMVLGCDKVLAKKNVTLMEHRVSRGGEGTTPSTFMEDIQLSQLEAQVLGLKWEDWIKVARGPKDHVFTKDEIKKYKLVTEWID